MTAPKTIMPTLSEQSPSVVLIALARVHAERMQQMLDGLIPFPPGRNGLDAMTALRGWRGILAAASGNNVLGVCRNKNTIGRNGRADGVTSYQIEGANPSTPTISTEVLDR